MEIGAGGSQIFENYKAKIKQRSATTKPATTDIASTSTGFLALPEQHELQRRKSCENISKAVVDPDLGDSSRFQRRSHIRSTWSSNRIAAATNRKRIEDLKIQIQTTTTSTVTSNNKKPFLHKIGKMFTSY